MRTSRKKQAGRSTGIAGSRWLLALLALVPLFVACGDRDLTGRDDPLRPGEFIEVIVELRHAEWEASRMEDPDSAAVAFQERKLEILESHRVTEAALRRFVERHHRRPGMMAAVWDSIANRLQDMPTVDAADRLVPVDDEW